MTNRAKSEFPSHCRIAAKTNFLLLFPARFAHARYSSRMIDRFLNWGESRSTRTITFLIPQKKTGTVQGKYQPDGILGYIGDDYILEPIGGKTAINFSVPENSHGTQEFVPGKSLRCYWNRIEAECFISTIPWISTEPLKRAVSIWNSLTEWL